MISTTISAGRIFNVDETGLITVQKPDRIIAQKTVKQIGSATILERAKHITLCCCMSAAGLYIHPMFMFPLLRIHQSLERNGPPGSFYSCSKNGWMMGELFQICLIYFTKIIHPAVTKTPEDPVLIILITEVTPLLKFMNIVAQITLVFFPFNLILLIAFNL